MRKLKVLGLMVIAAFALTAIAAIVVEAGPALGETPLPDNEERALIAGSIAALAAAGALRIGKSTQCRLNTSLAQITDTASTTQQLAAKVTTTASPQLRASAFTTREFATTAPTGANSQQIAGFENQLPNPQYDRKAWTFNFTMAC